VVEKSPGVEIANLLASEGYIVTAYDPMANSEAKKHLEKSVHITHSLEECTRFSETLLIMTTWPDFTAQITPEFIKQLEFCKTIIDCWRVLSDELFEGVCQVVHLGKGYTADTGNLENLPTPKEADLLPNLPCVTIEKLGPGQVGCEDAPSDKAKLQISSESSIVFKNTV
jgi:hypothetical protein